MMRTTNPAFASMEPPVFSIVTPSYQSSAWLKLCIASVADQGISAEHLVHDADSTDGTLDWLPSDPRVHAHVEKDRGMYDAINRGLRRARGQFIAYLNCDEQYLPGTLALVADFFAKHPDIDIVFGDVVVVNAQGEYLFHRKVQVPLLHHLWVSHLPILSCAMFFRRKLIDEDGLFFDPSLRAVGDAEWMLRVLQRRIRMTVLRRFTSVFTMLDANLGASETARHENAAMRASAPAWVRCLHPALILHHRLRRLAGGIYFQTPFSFELYTPSSPQARVRRDVQHPRFRWRTPA